MVNIGQLREHTDRYLGWAHTDSTFTTDAKLHWETARTWWLRCTSGNRTLTLPNECRRYPTGKQVYVFNDFSSNGSITIRKSDATEIVTIASGFAARVVLTSNSTAAGGWDYVLDAQNAKAVVG